MTGVEVALIVGTVVAAAASAGTAIAASQQQAKAHDYNRKVAQQQAEQARANAALQEESQREHARRVLAANQAAVGAAGVTMEGSPLLVQMDVAQQAEYEAQRIRYRGAVGATGLESEAELQQFYAGAARSAGYMQAGTSLLAGTVSAGSRYYGRTARESAPSPSIMAP